MQEIWKDIEGYEGLYQISNYGNVKSLNYKGHMSEHLLSKLPGEYKRVILYKNKCKKTIAIHRLVAQAFIPNPNNYPQVNHKDENKHNNCVNNLEWCTHKQNMNYGSKQDKESKRKTKYHVLQYDLQGNLIKKWFNLREIILNTNYKRITIMYCCRGKLKTAYGYAWKYELIDSE